LSNERERKRIETNKQTNKQTHRMRNATWFGSMSVWGSRWETIS
jgi:hypothetical protein